jgi:hypothetical protein
MLFVWKHTLAGSGTTLLGACHNVVLAKQDVADMNAYTVTEHLDRHGLVSIRTAGVQWPVRTSRSETTPTPVALQGPIRPATSITRIPVLSMEGRSVLYLANEAHRAVGSFR